MGIFCGLLAALSWGTTDVFIMGLTRRVGTSRALVYTQLGCLLTICLLLLAQHQTPTSNPKLWLLVLGCGVCHVAGMLLMYRAFEIGSLALVSPIGSGFAVVTALLALASGERPAAAALLGALILCCGVVLVTRSHSDQKATMAGVPHAIGSAFAFGAMFWALGFVTPHMGPVWPLLVLRLMALSSAVFTFLMQKRRNTLEPITDKKRIWPLTLGVVATDTIAWIAFNVGVRSDYTTIVTALASLYSAVTVVIAWGLFRERLAPSQWTGVAIPESPSSNQTALRANPSSPRRTSAIAVRTSFPRLKEKPSSTSRRTSKRARSSSVVRATALGSSRHGVAARSRSVGGASGMCGKPESRR